MCGIAGTFGNPDRALVERMIRRITHRGPDGQGVAVVGRAALGSARLSLVDFEGGAQPAAGPGGLTLVYNGEVYNHAALRGELERAGVAMRGRGDTEVVLRLLELRGEGGLEALEGMFALAASDGERLLLARDAFGIKPLFYALVDGGRRLIFASELKALLEDPALPRAIDRAALVEWATFRHMLGERALLRGISQVPPGGILEVTRGAGGVLRLRAGRHSQPRPVELPEREDELVDLLCERLSASVRAQALADHPVGAFLSGGLDSAVLVALMARGRTEPLHTFSIADDPASADLEVGRRLAACLGVEHHEIALDPEALVEALPTSIWALEAPTEPSIVESASPSIRRYVKAALCGDGADELFAGYAVHVTPSLWLASSVDRYNRLVRSGEVRVGDCASSKAVIGGMIGLDPAALRSAVHRFFLEGQLSDAHLLVWDRGAMASGLEVRVPYLDRGVRDLALALPWEHRVRGKTSKALLREVARRVLPDAMAAEIVGRRKLAAPSAVRRTMDAIEQAARTIVPPNRPAHPLRGFCATPGQELLLDLFTLIFVGRGGAAPDGLNLRELYTAHRKELEAALAAAVT